tara:strand:- start:1550 stop:2641 length:1092 start_codon:yes stop_codon:yes gene_type:complete
LSDKRLVTFDTLRGFFVFLALYEHYNYFFNFLFLDYHYSFTPQDFSFVYNLSAQNKLQMDHLSYMFMKTFGAWVSQVYIALALFNLGMKADKLTKEKMKRNNKWFALLFFAFFLENILISRSIGQVFSPNALMVWMMILFFFNTCHFYGGKYVTIIMALLIGSVNFFAPWREIFERAQVNFYQHFNVFIDLEARAEVFIYSALIGYLFGLIYYKIDIQKLKLIGSLSFLGAMSFMHLAPLYPVDKADIFLHEYFWAFHRLGSLCVWFTISSVICLACVLEKKERPVILPFFTNIGRKSLGFFLGHKLYFIYFFIPVYLVVAYVLGLPIYNGSPMIWLAIILYGLFYFSLLPKVKRLFYQNSDS